ncbi:MAG TPA: DUF72 domain-containing protein [Verrucomicrobiae bacterium]|nr:DUF72 domain-containing protein [Verrucomicrobiae bacterium]
MTAGQVFIGTSGWEYKEWAGDFYRDARARDHFSFYTRHFPTVEINATFYRLPGLGAVHGWRKKASEGFVFAVKGSRFITHIKRLNELHGSVNKFFRRVRPLGDKIGPFLWQLPPNFQKDLSRLNNFLRRLPRDFSHAFEFRHVSWLDSETRGLLKDFNAALVSVSSMKMPADFSVTADFVYIRFHGLSGGPRHDYTPDELSPWAKHIKEQSAAGRRVFAYFNNDLNVRAPRNAKLLMELCGASFSRHEQEM